MYCTCIGNRLVSCYSLRVTRKWAGKIVNWSRGSRASVSDSWRRPWMTLRF